MSDEGRFFILVLTRLAAIAAIAAIVAELAIVKDLSGMIKDLHIGLAAATIVSACYRLFARSKLVEEAVEKFIKEMPVEYREERKDEKQCRRP